MKSEAQILLVGRDEMLLQTRKLILGSYFQVDIAGRVSHAAQLMAERSFDLIVLCSSLADECARIAELARSQDPRPKTLTLSAKAGHPCGNGAGDEVMEEIGPLALMRKSAAMLGLEMKAMGRAIPKAPQAETEKMQAH
jgi:hypothetical protein